MATTMVEALIRAGIRTSKLGDYALPLPKTYTGALAEFAPWVRMGITRRLGKTDSPIAKMSKGIP